MQVLVTGASGFLGRHLVAALRGSADVRPVEGDVRDPATFEPLPRADLVYHLAAVSSVPDSLRDPARTWAVNAGGTMNLLEWARGRGVGRLVLVSSAHVYGPAEYTPIDERHPTRPVSPYGASKLAAEAMARAYGASYGMEVVVVRPFNVYGPGQARGFLVPDILEQIAEGRQLVMGDPRPVRDFTYVDDAIELLRLAGTVPGVGGETFNLGSGQGHPVETIVRTAIEVTGTSLRPRYDEARFRAAEVKELVVDNAHARKRLGWAPGVGLRQGVERAWRAVRARGA
ncbi:MAG TPA: GDP-mannose 4,6-dehydratase [Candidatus Thermoplasmatota archaeon]|nr:GDP-mannose 4,6-dehydratase [Candidatus Thermoplasmatota archaeon]